MPSLKEARCLCVCVCGEQREVYAHHLRGGLTKSCGCMQREQRHTNGLRRHVHGESSMAREALVLSVAGVTAIMLTAYLLLLILY
jgi:hypothetical protein